jgi:hypothetical protein
MYRPALTILSAALLVAAILFVVARENRYEILVQPDQDGVIYKLDKRTGRMWLVSENETEDVNGVIPPSKSPVSPETEAIAKVRTDSFVLPGGLTTESTIEDALRHKRGILHIYGWRARRIDDQTYLVGYLYDEGPNTQVNGWLFEVNRTADILRNVIGDPDLEKKYADWSTLLNH